MYIYIYMGTDGYIMFMFVYIYICIYTIYTIIGLSFFVSIYRAM